MKNLRLSAIALVLGFTVLTTEPALAQCSMCRAVAESGSKDDQTKVARGLNNGILYLLAMPYIIGGVAFFIWKRNRRNQPQV